MGFFKKPILNFGVALLAAPFLLGATSASRGAADVILEAQNLSLQKKRKKSIDTIADYLKTNKDLPAATKKDLINEAEKLSTIFYTEQAQQKFEHAESLLYSGSTEALSSYLEAEALEPQNLAIQLGRMRAEMFVRDCAAAEKTFDKANKINSFSGQLYVLGLQLQLCHNSKKAKTDSLQKNENLEAQLRLYELDFLLTHEFQQKKLAMAKKTLSQIIAIDKDFPETIYWQYQMANSEGNLKNELKAKYLSICKNMTSRLRRRYNLKPTLCHNAQGLEAEEE